MGNRILFQIFDQYSSSPKELYEQLRKYNNQVGVELYEEKIEDNEDEEGIDKKKTYYQKFIYINGTCIPTDNIGRIELQQEYIVKKSKYEYFIYIWKKYPSPNEEFFTIPFSSEEDRDRYFEILKGKLKMCNIEIF